MSKLDAELQRLFRHPTSDAATLELLTPEGLAHTLVIACPRGGDWEQVANLWQGVQADLELPAPALSISPAAGYQLWLPLAEPLPLPQAAAFLASLARRYLAELPPARLQLLPGAEVNATTTVPAYHPDAERWSAFIDPGMGSMFTGDMGLDLAPNLDRQADMLATVRPIRTREFEQALASLAEQVPTQPTDAAPLSSVSAPAPEPSRLGGGYQDPRQFLLDVMNDSGAPLRERIRAARALLPRPKGKARG